VTPEPSDNTAVLSGPACAGPEPSPGHPAPDPPGKEIAMAIADRIVELRRIRASELAPDPRNWRRHPQSQRNPLQAVLEQVRDSGLAGSPRRSWDWR